MNEELIKIIADLQEKETIAMIKDLIRAGVNPMEILEALQPAMELVGSRFEKGVYFIPDLFMAGEIMKQISEIVKPLLKKEIEKVKKGKVLIGTVEGDIHDIGKNIVTFMLDVNGYDVFDLGIDVPINLFIEKVREFNPEVVGLSGFLTLAFDSMKKTVEALEQTGLRDKVKIMIGGGQIDDEVRRYVRADAFGKDAMAAVNLCRQWIGG